MLFRTTIIKSLHSNDPQKFEKANADIGDTGECEGTLTKSRSAGQAV